ncbi:Acetyltransferase (GNAT) family protein [Paenibacillus sp. yr247]|uniref:GNAT family N-acetyltransferase n=1 Tax=Paenibacillus sp. yr247 TaxID=1761880 RepID=UPI000884BC83|nr:GNAT family N-acetyltransferase [Paenibacillus sp. yr247]SDN67302.1 Acetyltransferase (GNAT) family protein [Paenibacillus sp. yr247]
MIENMFSPDDMSNPQYRRFEVQQRGEGVYLIGWYNNTPIGGFLVHWSGPNDDHVTKYLDITHSAMLEGGLTIDEYRRKGVATAIIQEAERLAKEKGCAHIGLFVASTNNPGSKQLYEKLGYIDWEYGECTVSWEFIETNGNKRIDSENVIYMRKSL